MHSERRLERTLIDTYMNIERQPKESYKLIFRPLNLVRRWYYETMGGREYDSFWKEILDNNPGRPSDDDDWQPKRLATSLVQKR